MNRKTILDSQPHCSRFPPIDCYYLLLFITAYKLWISVETRNFIYDLLYKYFYILVNLFEFTDDELENNWYYKSYLIGKPKQTNADFLTFINIKNRDSSYLNTLEKTLSDFYQQLEQNMEYLYGKLDSTMFNLNSVSDIEKEINNIHARLPRPYDKPYEVPTINEIQHRLYFENIKDYPGKPFGVGRSFTRLRTPQFKSLGEVATSILNASVKKKRRSSVRRR